MSTINYEKSIDYYEDYLLPKLRHRAYAAGYLEACLREGEDIFLQALAEVAKAQGGIANLSKATKLNRENLYAMLSKEGNPKLSSLTAILDQLGFEMTFKPKAGKTKRAKTK